MVQVHHVGSAAMRASLAAGPAFLVVMMLGTLLDGRPVTVDPDAFLAVGGVVPFIVFGWCIAIIPNLIGAGVMGALGSSNVGLRMPAMWAMAGAAMAGVPVYLWPSAGDTIPATSLMATVGAVCALLCRARVRWDDAAD